MTQKYSPRGHLRGRPTALAVAAILLLSTVAAAAADTASAVEQPIARFLKAKNRAARGSVTVDVHTPDVHMSPCRSPRPFLPGSGQRTSGRLTVGVHCPGDRPVTRYFQATVSIRRTYIVAAHAIGPGDTLTADDLSRTRGDITRLRDDVATDEAALLGRQAVRRIGAGRPIAKTMVERPQVVHRGDRVRLIAQGAGFRVATQGKALGAGPSGGEIRVRTHNRAVVVGRIRDARTVVVSR